MNIFPQQNCKIYLYNEVNETLQNFKNEVSIHNGLVSYKTKKPFIGFFKEDGFKLITSVIGRGAFCTFDCSFQDDVGILKIRIHKAFRILIIIWAVFVLVSSTILTLTDIGKTSYSPILLGLVAILLMRFAVLKLVFKSFQKDGLKKLVLALNIKYIEKL